MSVEEIKQEQVLLKSVTIDNSPTAMTSLLLAPGIFTHLRILRVGLTSMNDIYMTRNIIVETAQTLEELCLSFQGVTPPPTSMC